MILLDTLEGLVRLGADLAVLRREQLDQDRRPGVGLRLSGEGERAQQCGK